MSDALRDFMQLVDMMRQAQRMYFASKKASALDAAKRYELLVDAEIARLKKSPAVEPAA